MHRFQSMHDKVAWQVAWVHPIGPQGYLEGPRALWEGAGVMRCNRQIRIHQSTASGDVNL